MNPRKLIRYGAISFACSCILYIYMGWTESVTPKPTLLKSPPIQERIIPPRNDTLPTRVEQQDWQPVKGSRNVFGIYSAYSILDRKPPELVVIGAKRKFVKEKIYCKYHFHEGGHLIESNPRIKDKFLGKVEILRTGTKPYYPNAGILLTCPLPTRTQFGRIVRPEMVSIIANNVAKPSNQLKIQYLNESRSTPYQYNFSVCVKPTFNFNESFHLVEWIEFYKMMGVQQFTFYNMTIGPEASCILDDYKNGRDPSIKLNILPWTNHHIMKDTIITDRDNVPQYNLAAAQNDCVYRHRGHHSKYMVFDDLDEFIMPREGKGNNFGELIHRLHSQHPKMKIGEYQFRNGFFILSRPDDPQLMEHCSSYRDEPLTYKICLESYLMKKSLREPFHKFTVRSKYIIIPERVVHTSTHHVVKFEKDFKSLHVSDKIAFSRHYRNFAEGNQSVSDGIEKGFGLRFVHSLSKTVEYFMKTCNLTLVDV